MGCAAGAGSAQAAAAPAALSVPSRQAGFGWSSRISGASFAGVSSAARSGVAAGGIRRKRQAEHLLRMAS